MSKEGNILLVANWESNVGYAWWLMENFWITISNHFNKQGKKCYLIYPKITEIPESISSSDVEVFECDFRGKSFSNLRMLHEFIKSNAIRYIYLSDSPAYSLFYVLLRLWGVKKIVVHDHTPGDRTKPAPLRKLLKTIIQRIPFYTADHFIAVTDFVYNRFKEVSCIPPNKCSVAPNGIKPIDLNNADVKYAYKAFDIPEDRVIAITTGRASYYKGIDFFIECANELVNKQGLNQLHFLYCGDGPDMNDFQELANRLNVEEHFTFAGKRHDIQKILPSCQIGFHAATGEVGYSLSILEYMSAGLATIVPDNVSTSGATTDCVNGLLYKPGNLESAVAAIKTCLDRSIRRELGNNAHIEITEYYNIRNTNTKLIKILDKVYLGS